MNSILIRVRRLQLLIIGILFCNYISGQDNKPNSLKVGDKAPVIKVLKWIKGNPVTQFTKGNIYVVEFGATWCTPCRAMIPHLTDIARKYKGRISVVSIFAMEDIYVKSNDKNPAYVSKVERFVKLQGEKMNYIVGVDGPGKEMEKTWLKASGNIGVPYSFVIDKDGNIAWIGTGSLQLEKVLEFVSSANYSSGRMLTDNREASLSEIPYDVKKLLLLNGNGGNDTDFVFRSIIAVSKGRLKGPQQHFINNYSWVKGTAIENEMRPHIGRVQTVNVSLINLYYLAYADTINNQIMFRGWNWEYPDTVKNPHLNTSYGRFWFAPALEVEDIRPFQTSRNSLQNKYHYSLKVQIQPPPTAGYLQEIMQRDLKSYFGYDVVVEKRLMPCWNLVVIDSSKVIANLITKTPNRKLKFQDQSDPFIITNGIVRDITMVLGSTFGYTTLDYGKLPVKEQAPFIDETGIKEEIDFKFDKRWSFDEVKKYLNDLGLDLIKSSKEMKVVVIRDAKLTE